MDLVLDVNTIAQMIASAPLEYYCAHCRESRTEGEAEQITCGFCDLPMPCGCDAWQDEETGESKRCHACWYPLKTRAVVRLGAFAFEARALTEALGNHTGRVRIKAVTTKKDGNVMRAPVIEAA